MVSAVDDGVGRILDKLQALGLTENTIVFFLSDNGGPKQDNASDNGPLRGGKGSLFEGGIRVPFAMQWPRYIKPGSTYDRPVISLDIFSTLLANVSGMGKPRNQLDGVDLMPFLSGKQTTAPHEYLFWRQFDQRRYGVLHASGLKEVLFADSALQIYDLNTDIGEKMNVADKHAPQIQDLEGQRKKWEAQMIAPVIWGLNQEAVYQKGKRPI